MLLSVKPFFCGQDDECLDVYSKWALNQAKHNIEKWYKFISLYEHLELSFKLYENIFPEFFTGMLKLYKEQGGKNA